VPGGVVAEVVVVVVVVVVVGVLVLVEVLDVVVVSVVEVSVGMDAVETVFWWHSWPARSAIVLAPWLRFLRSVGSIVAGRVWTSLLRTALALRAAPQLPA
jgi:hypothetical protein